MFKILPETNFGWVIGAASGAAIYYVMMRSANRK
jgi:NCS1 family nucleobase:cation symporter-1